MKINYVGKIDIQNRKMDVYRQNWLLKSAKLKFEYPLKGPCVGCADLELIHVGEREGEVCEQVPVHPKPYTLHPTPYTLHPTPYTLHSTPYTLHPTPYTQTPKP